MVLQDVRAAGDELERAVSQLGFKGAMINGYSNIGDMDTAQYLDKPPVWDFWARVEALDVLAGTVRAVRDEPMQATLTLPQAAQMVVAWSLVHGFAMLLLDNRLKQLIARLPAGIDEMAFLPAILSAALPKT